ncbi:thiamine-phosphate kinase [Tsukamurella sp. 8F]|uniref:thiamine-phosphate kinase n=1 Tax=Tsukamurella sp. 8F TaxID=3031961 RepID=UPI0023B8C4DD|nr:thiamine-phosphate kinase [Tsukamurella sp. 8F]MDF0586134.1 thiamine-phosphate kinase [Tsukamurella sp. 8F]
MTDNLPSTAADLGEDGVIALATAALRPDPRVTVGPGDDAAVVTAPDGRVVISTDAVVEGRHFRFDLTTPEHVGRRVIAQNAADIAAMGAVCTAFTVTLGCPPDTPSAVLAGISAGVAAGAAQVGGVVVGGDVVRTEQVVVSVTALGDLEGRSPVLLSGARAGDVVALAGVVGRSAAGLAVLEAGVESPSEECLDVYRVPRPPLTAGPSAADAGATAMTDVSDGLIRDARAIARASGVALDLGALTPDDDVVSCAHAVGADPYEWLYAGGEDHALLATFPPDIHLPQGFRRVGRVRAGHGVTIDGAPATVGGGWTSFGVKE